jgi:uncharacterized protein (TIGR03086 family)
VPTHEIDDVGGGREPVDRVGGVGRVDEVRAFDVVERCVGFGQVPARPRSYRRSMNPTYATLTDRFTDVVDAVPNWLAASPCEGWSVGDVVDHVVSTQRDFLRAHTDLAPEPTTADPAQRWAAHRALVAQVLPGLADVAYETPFGPSTVGQTMTTFYGFDLIVHRWDIATGAGLVAPLGDEEIDILEAVVPTFGEHLYAEGICKGPLDVGPDADRTARILAVLGRAA